MPRPNLARALPANYRVRKLWYQPLSNPTIPDVVVVSVGPPTGPSNFHSSDLQVLSFDPIARRWIVAFDAQKVPGVGDPVFNPAQGNATIIAPVPPSPSTPPITTGPMLDPKAQVDVGQVAFVRFQAQKGTDLVFTASTSYGGSGVGDQLEVVSFRNQEANIEYAWNGEGLLPFRIAGPANAQRLLERAWFWTLADPHCCPARTYAFTVAGVRGTGGYSYITEAADQRPWLGAYVQAASKSPNSALQVVGVVPGSPAARVLRRGDEIIALTNAPKVKNPPANGPNLLDAFTLYNAGQTAAMTVLRGGQTLNLRVRLGSMLDDSALGASPPPGAYSIDTI